MEHEAGERRLAAIMFTDIVGYTALMGESEATGGEVRRRQPEVLRPLVERYHGEWVQDIGDESLSTFPSAVDAANCALAIQAALEDDPVLSIRIGIHVGDVLFEAGSIHGDGVNLAARVRPLAEPGGVCVSDEAQRSLASQSNIEARSLGVHELKNVNRPVEVFAVRGTAAAPRPLARDGVRAGVWIGSGLAAVLLGAVALWLASAPDEPTIPGFSGRPAIAVPPFDSLSGDVEYVAFAGGLAEELNTRLASWHSFPVISPRTSSDPDLPDDVQEVGRRLRARYVVEGSVREAAGRVRINVRVTDGTTGRNVWANHYDREFREVLVLQGEIAGQIAGAMNPALLHTEMERAVHQEAGAPDAWNAAMRGWWHFSRTTEADMAEAQRLFERAVELDPQWSYAHAGLALTHFWQIASGWSGAPEQSERALLAAAQTAVTLDELGAEAHHALGHAFMVGRQRDRMIAAFAQGAELNPSDHLANSCYGLHLALVGRSDEALARLERAMSLSPRDPLAFMPRMGMAWAHFARGDYTRSLEWADKSIRRAPGVVFPYSVAAASAAHLGDEERARRSLEERTRLRPLTREAFELLYGVATADFRERMLAGLRGAGWDG